MRFKTFLKLSVLVAYQLFSLYIVLFGGMWIGWSCKES
ncbi:putative membrane protein [Synechococcus sp. PROS-U-1]|nr:putative membrane protein [Synechococcus sp. PROS-U-1]